MISFRYHLVSIVAVFLALALGIVIGTTALNGPITKNLRNQVNDVKKQRDNLSQQVSALQNQVGNAGQFAATYGSQLVADTLKGQRVLVVSMPNATSGMQDGIDRQLSASGATITGRMSLTRDYVKPSQGGSITSLATGPLHPSDLTLPATSDAGALGAALLAHVLIGDGQSTDLTQVLGGFSELHLISVSSNSVNPSTSVVVLANGALGRNSYAGAAELDLVAALAKEGAHVVVAGGPSSAGTGGLISRVRTTSSARNVASTVDDADSAFGQVSAVLALAAAVNGQQGQYGTEQGADALFPAPNK